MSIPKTRCHVLAADDEYWIREKIRNLLDWEALNLVFLEPVSDGEQALQILKKNQVDVLITDINMPFLNGLELISAVKKIAPDMPIIVLSGYDDFALVREALRAGVMDYLLKPVNKADLLTVLERAVSRVSTSESKAESEALVRDKMSEAASLLRDRELSECLSEEVSPTKTQEIDLDLQTAFFTPILVQFSIQANVQLFQGGVELSSKIKSILTHAAEKNALAVFKNIYVRGEYVALLQGDSSCVTTIAESIAESCSTIFDYVPFVAVGRECYSFQELAFSYRQMCSALLTLPSRSNRLAFVRELPSFSPQKRIEDEQEKRLTIAIQNKNRNLVESILFNEIGLSSCEDWPLIEVKQTSEYLLGLLFRRANGHLLSSLEAENFSAQLDSAFNARNFDLLYLTLEQALDELLGDPQSGPVSDSMKNVVREIQDDIEQNFYTDLSLNYYAQRYRVDRSYLSKSFKQITGINLMTAIASTRIEAAVRYIKRGELSLSEIAEVVGYEEFNRVFKKIIGSSPSDYRNAIEKEKKNRE